MVVAAAGGDIQTITIEIINNPDDPTMTVIRMIGMKMIITIIIIEIIIIIHNVEVTAIIVMIILVVMATIVDSETILFPGVVVVVVVMIIDHFIIGMTITTIGAHLHRRFTMIEGSTMTTNPQPNRLETTHDGDLLNALRLIFRTDVLLTITTVIVAVVSTTMLDIMIIALLVVGEALRGRGEEDTMIGKAVIDMGLAAVEGGMISVVERRAGRDHHPWHHLTIKIIGLKTR
mmetsp:Transcript_22592/g.37203  ORF Transcript_22592/g.37203 Transcript_22592/m.37203 type:complete len:232 (+) Transcript_22592:963-1658(+)